MTTQQDVVTAWNSVLKAAEEVQSYVRPGSFFSDRKRFDELVEKQERAYADYVHALTDFANESG
jgi:phage shock protein A